MIRRMVSFGSTAILQGIVQLLGLIVGLLLVRSIEPSEYSWYSLVVSVTAVASLLIDSGISSGIVSIAGRDKECRSRVGEILSAAINQRSRIFPWVAALLTCASIVLLARNGCSTIRLLSLGSLALGIVLTGPQIPALEAGLKASGRIERLQFIQIASSGIRLLIVFFLTLQPLWAEFFLGAIVISQLFSIVLLKRALSCHFSSNFAATPNDKKEFSRFARRMLPQTAYFALSGQINILIVSILGNREGIADLAASGRIALVFNVFTSVAALRFQYPFARLPARREILRKRFMLYVGGIGVIGAPFVLLFAIYPQLNGMILGARYADIGATSFWLLLGSLAQAMSGVAWMLAVSRGWLVSPALNISMQVAAQLLAVILVDLSSTQGVAIMSAIVSILFLCINVTYFAIKVATHKSDTAH